MMKEIRIEDLPKEYLEDLCFHTTSERNLGGDDGIEKNGLQARAGENTYGDSDKTKKVCFSKGMEGIAILWDGTIPSFMIEDGSQAAANARLYNMTKDNVYLLCDIQEGVHYSNEQIDYRKTTGGLPYIKQMRKHLSEIKEEEVDRWDMRTFDDKGIEAERLSVLSTNGSTNIIDILKYCQKQVKESNSTLADELTNLDNFIEYAQKQRELEKAACDSTMER